MFDYVGKAVHQISIKKNDKVNRRKERAREREREEVIYTNVLMVTIPQQSIHVFVNTH